MTECEIKALKQCWSDMKQRCYNHRSQQYHNYGARGIRVCDRWLQSFDAFVEDMGVRPPGHSIERIDVNGNYEPRNCRWANTKHQTRNRRNSHLITHEGKTMVLRDWASLHGLKEATLLHRIRKGMDFGAALTTPVNQVKRSASMIGNRLRWSKAALAEQGEKV